MYVPMFVRVSICACVSVHMKRIRRQCQELSVQTELEEENISTADRKKVDLTNHKRLDRLDGKLDIYEMGNVAQLWNIYLVCTTLSTEENAKYLHQKIFLFGASMRKRSEDK